MEKIRFSCPRCGTLMQSNADMIGIDVACPQCQHQFKLIENGPSHRVPAAPSYDSPTMPPHDRLEASEQSTSKLETGSEMTTEFQATPTQELYSVPPSQSSDPRPLEYSRQRYSCPQCLTGQFPRYYSETMTIGWVFLAVGLASSFYLCYTFPIAFLGLLIRRRYKACPRCRNREF